MFLLMCFRTLLVAKLPPIDDSRMTKRKSLDLESQIQLLTRVQFITRFSSHLIHLSGAQGSGKTWLAHTFLEDYAPDCHQVLLMCQRGQTDIQHRTLLLQQFVDQAMFNEHDSLCQSVEHLLAHQPHKLMVVIDDAHLLSSTLIAELWALALYANQHSELQINIVLFANRNELNQTLTHVAHGSGIVPVELEIDDSCHQNIILHNLPQVEGITMNSNINKKPLLPIVIGGGVIVLIAGSYLFMAPSSSSKTTSITVPSAAVSTVVTIDKNPLPPQLKVNPQGLTVGRQNDIKGQERIVISDQQIDAIIDDHMLDEHSVTAEDTGIVNKAIKNMSSSTSKLDWSLKLAADKKQLLLASPKHYAIQLAATQSLAVAKAFITTHNLSDVMLYQTERNQQSWFIVVTGNYATASLARTAKRQLAPSLQQLKPWLKSYRKIAQEIDRLK